MRHVVTLVVLVFFTLAPRSVWGQTVVQLPTFRNFGMSTTVSVPDRGRTYLGGINRSFNSSTRRRAPLSPLSSRSHSRGASSSGVSVNAFVHDFDEMDRAIRSQVANRKPDSVVGVRIPDRQDEIHQLPRVSDVRKQMAAKKATQYAKAASQIRSAVRLENAGKYAAARAKYRVAYVDAKPEWQAKIRVRVMKLNTRLARLPEEQPFKL